MFQVHCSRKKAKGGLAVCNGERERERDFVKRGIRTSLSSDIVAVCVGNYEWQRRSGICL
jgi:hypothetical protein